MRRFFVSPDRLREESITLDDELLRHLTVLRLQAGDEILLLDGTGCVCRCLIESLSRKEGRVRCLERWREEDTAMPIHLLQGVPKGDKMDIVLQKGVELGGGRFSPVICKRSVTRNAGSLRRQERWQRIVNEAARQSRRPVLPHLDGPRPLKDAIDRCDAGLRLLLWEEGSSSLQDVLPGKSPSSVAILVGPEGGLTAGEADLACRKGFKPVHLGPRILRTETAALAVISVLQYLYGDWTRLPQGQDEGRDVSG